MKKLPAQGHHQNYTSYLLIRICPVCLHWPADNRYLHLQACVISHLEWVEQAVWYGAFAAGYTTYYLSISKPIFNNTTYLATLPSLIVVYLDISSKYQPLCECVIAVSFTWLVLLLLPRMFLILVAILYQVLTLKQKHFLVTDDQLIVLIQKRAAPFYQSCIRHLVGLPHSWNRLSVCTVASGNTMPSQLFSSSVYNPNSVTA